MRKSLLILLFSIAVFANASVEDTCKYVTATRPNIGLDFCIATLNYDPLSRYGSDPTQMAITATKLSISNATNIVSKITTLIQTSESNRLSKECLNACSEIYSDAIDRLEEAVKNMDEKRYEDATTFLSAAMDASDDCEEAFGEEDVKSPVGEEDAEYGRLVDIALTIVAAAAT